MFMIWTSSEKCTTCKGNAAVTSRTGRHEGVSKQRCLARRDSRGEGVVRDIPCLRDMADGEDMRD
ncbi:hypothetical protein DVH24_023619 [Malus domestica]|uniref:Uncharacterized protein n=1 Tax=Malus domestica TaxID=3750 RepID=A0A498I5I6_MALDO|nr:hypothetical protein DVH24_023619 [Malus domestica]